MTLAEIHGLVTVFVSSHGVHTYGPYRQFYYDCNTLLYLNVRRLASTHVLVPCAHAPANQGGLPTQVLRGRDTSNKYLLAVSTKKRALGSDDMQTEADIQPEVDIQPAVDWYISRQQKSLEAIMDYFAPEEPQNWTFSPYSLMCCLAMVAAGGTVSTSADGSEAPRTHARIANPIVFCTTTFYRCSHRQFWRYSNNLPPS